MKNAAAALALIACVTIVAFVSGLPRLGAEVRPSPVAAQSRRVSPHESVTATVDGARVTIVYGRPSMRGRVIFGGLVPYDRVWCPGADEATTLESSKELLLGGLRVPPGPHTIWILPTPARWTLIVSKDESGFHTRYYPSRDLGRVELMKRALESPVEQLTFAVAPAAAGGGEVTMSWERTSVAAPFTVVR